MEIGVKNWYDRAALRPWERNGASSVTCYKNLRFGIANFQLAARIPRGNNTPWQNALAGPNKEHVRLPFIRERSHLTQWAHTPISVQCKFIPSVKRLTHTIYTHVYHVDPDGRQVASVFSRILLQTGLLKERVRMKSRGNECEWRRKKRQKWREGLSTGWERERDEKEEERRTIFHLLHMTRWLAHLQWV